MRRRLPPIKKQGIKLEDHPQLVIRPYLHEMEYALAAADICVGRAGATYLAEITACGLPAVLVPYPFASENHQEYNARSLVDCGAAEMILDKELSGESLCRALKPLVEDNGYRAAMAEKAGASRE